MDKAMMAAVVGLLLHGELDYEGKPWASWLLPQEAQDRSTFSHKFRNMNFLTFFSSANKKSAIFKQPILLISMRTWDLWLRGIQEVERMAIIPNHTEPRLLLQ